MSDILVKATAYKIHIHYSDVIGYVKSNSMIPEVGLNLLYELALVADMLDGCVAEAGVAKGGVIYLLASMMPTKQIYGFDSWLGLPPSTKNDYLNGAVPAKEGWGSLCVPTKRMKEELAKFGKRVRLIQGWFKDTLSIVSHKSFCFVHLDADRYDSTMQCLEFFWPRLVSGGIMFFDDYGFVTTPGATTAVDEFFNNKDYYSYDAGGRPIIRHP